METIDDGHKYKLDTLDGEEEVILTYVKRNDPPEKFPGNEDAYPGTTMQEVMRSLIDRLEYLDAQQWNPINSQIVGLLRLCIWLLECRASEHKGEALSTKALYCIEGIPIRESDGHLNAPRHQIKLQKNNE